MPPSQPPNDSSVTSARRIVATSATLLLVGIAITVIHTGSEAGDSALSVIGQVLAAGSFVGLVWGLHRFGRLGPEGPTSGSAP